MKYAGNIGPTWHKADWRWLKMAEFEPDTSVEVWRRTIRLHKPFSIEIAPNVHKTNAGLFQLTNSPATHSFHLPALLYSETLPPRALVLERPNEVLNRLSTMKKNKHLNTCIWQNITSKCHCSVYSSLKEFHVSVSTRLAKLRSLPWIKQWSHKWKNV